MSNKKNLIGNKINSLTIIAKLERKDQKSNWWLCLCDCGVFKEYPTSSLRRAKTCGVTQNHKKYNFKAGDKIHLWTVLDGNYGTDFKIICECLCGTVKKIPVYALVLGTDYLSCGCYNKKTRISYIQLPDGEASFNRLFRQYKRQAKNRDLSFNLSTDEFKKMTKSSCHYCGKEPNKTIINGKTATGYVYNGIDRVDNTIGYEPTNCVSSCKPCNIHKEGITIELCKKTLAAIEKCPNQIPQYKTFFKNKEKKRNNVAIGEGAFNNILGSYKYNAKKRGHSFDLSKEEFLHLTNQNCYYCDKEPKNMQNNIASFYIYNGIDRLDNSLGYFWENCVPSCKPCNTLKKSVSLTLIKKILFFISSSIQYY